MLDSIPQAQFKNYRGFVYSDRGELEVADLINAYISDNLRKLLQSESLVDYWIDTGNSESLVNATAFVRDLKNNRGMDIAQFALGPKLDLFSLKGTLLI